MMRSCGGLIGCDQHPHTALVIGGCAVQSSTPESALAIGPTPEPLVYACWLFALHYCYSCSFTLVCRYDDLTSTICSSRAKLT
jgi:hypothetical protein